MKAHYRGVKYTEEQMTELLCALAHNDVEALLAPHGFGCYLCLLKSYRGFVVTCTDPNIWYAVCRAVERLERTIAKFEEQDWRGDMDNAG